ncbi:aminotransferase class IV [Corynebacterium halotolerans]|uniref:4-amino-4-deoxychorismate lyase n=1 Tax=Corynebacterium halotolerans YIM 70093 = DSM 44683 TaxID=1121362 RepID=M1NQN2_9CORY|nr:aminotransferase class IV [Corynebacterium halotolerans]AGF71827.1 hypothetical protein A605_04080 [Corynebacterium halotolerans YIM 70093 = DSM 44683]
MYASTFLMRDGRVANLTEHLDRLRDAGNVSPVRIGQLRGELRDLGPGLYLPLIQAVGATVSLDPRPTIRPEDEIIVDAEGIPDERLRPTDKGPDLGWQVQRLARLRQSGADEGLLIDERGAVVSGVLSALLCLDEGTAHISAHPRTSYSVTLDAALALLAESGVDVVEHPEGLGMPMLRTTETWALNSSEGVRLVTGWLEYGSVLPPRTGGRPRAGAPTHREINGRMWELAEEV